MSSAKALEATVRPRTGMSDRFARRIVAAFQDVPPIDAVATWDAVLIATVWYPDLDRAVAIIAELIPDELIWSAASVRHRQETIQSGGRAKEITLEPIMLVEVSTLPEYVGSVIGDLSARRGLVLGQRELVDGALEVSAEVPLSELRGYDSLLSEITGGHGVVSVSTLKYNIAPPHVGPPDEPVSMALRA